MEDIAPPRPLLENDPRDRFCCGRPSLDTWFHRHAWRNQLLNVSRTSVACDAATGAIAGYVSLSTAQISRAYVPKPAQRNAPDPIPAILLGQLAVDLSYGGHGLGRSLVAFALHTAVRAADTIGCFCVLTHPLDDDVRRFYRQCGFEDLPFDPRRSMAIRIADLRLHGF